MDIKVDRTISPEGDLVFTITAKNAHKVRFGETELNTLEILEECQKCFNPEDVESNKLVHEIVGLIHAAKEKAFDRILKSLKFSIREQLDPMMEPIRQEIYNWIYDAQEPPVKQWMQEFDPQRTTYYFHNDKQSHHQQMPESDDEDDDEY